MRPHAAINEALAFHQAIGTERKAARLHYLTLRAERLKTNPRIRIHSNLDEVRSGAGTDRGDRVGQGVEGAVGQHRIITATIVREDYQGLRITPNVYTTLEEIDMFAMAMKIF